MKKGAISAVVLFILVVGILGAVLLYSGGSSATSAVPIDKETICHMPGQKTMTLPIKAAIAHLEKHASGESDFTGPCCPGNNDCEEVCDGVNCQRTKCSTGFTCETAGNGASCCVPDTTTTSTTTSTTDTTEPPSSTTTTVIVPSTTVTTTTPSTTTTQPPSTTTTSTVPTSSTTTVTQSPSTTLTT